MTQPTGPQPRLDVRGAVDLSGLGRTPTPAPGGPASGAGAQAQGAVVDVTEATFADVVQQSLEVPVVFSLWASWSEASSTVTADLARLAGELEGRFLLARVDVEGSPQIAQAFQAQSVPAVVAVLKGQPVPLFQGPASSEDVRAVIDQLLQAAAANGVTGRVAVEQTPQADEPEEPPLPPLHQAAFDAIERGDLAAAAEAYDQALRENPRDDMASAGRAQVALLERTRDVDLAAAREAAAQRPDDVAAQLAVADLDLLGGKVDDAFARLVDLVRRTAADEREQVRVRLVELFTVVGDADPRVLAARRALANALY
ncbi:tetratricopeptide repeat protein [Cellulomonas sp. APG4]|uniref:tetratricopeptide repeat protein n=1 Tax=Cellulomonas sp. APG4 TaxID=1538656 RepID=UPI00137B3187|nr:tetratricopeptide repeat protein [Cellulomonas sp. APG4]NCT90677.1 tetratricopeptide repeat protein [Cellulomonas sp. APG4]